MLPWTVQVLRVIKLPNAVDHIALGYFVQRWVVPVSDRVPVVVGSQPMIRDSVNNG